MLRESLCPALAFMRLIDDMRAGRLVVDEPLANRVRSGRKQPQRVSARVIVPASHLSRIVLPLRPALH